MQTLYKLSYLKIKSKVRNVFSKPLSAILTIVAILFYGGTAVMMFFIPKEASDVLFQADFVGINLLLLILVGVIALMTFSLLLNRNQALFYQEDAFYMFTSPFSYKQMIMYLIMNNVVQAFLLSGIIFYVAIIFSMGFFSFSFLLLAFFFTIITQLFILMLIDYFYLLEIVYPKTKPIKWLFVAVIVLITAAILGSYLLSAQFDLKSGLQEFALSNLFHLVPLFGWLKYTFLAIYDHNYLIVFIMSLVFLGLTAIIYFLLINIKGDFYAEALDDAEKMTAYIKASKKGKSLKRSEKVYTAKSNFHLGERAVFDKSILLLKKGRNLLNLQDFFIIFLYLGLAYFTTGKNGYTMYSNILIFWILASVMQSSIQDELKTYYIYLIPGSPYKKMVATVIPLLIKPLVVVFFAYILGGIVFSQSFITIVSSILQYSSIMFVMIAGNVLSIRIMKSQNNALVENLLRMVIILIAFIPLGIIILLIAFAVGFENLSPYLAVCMFIVNTLVATLIILLCAPMLNGMEISITEE